MEIPSCTLRLAWLAVLTPILATAGAALRNMRVLSRILKALPKTLPKTLPKGLVVPKMSVPKLPVLTRVKVFAGRVRIASRAGIKEAAVAVEEDPAVASECVRPVRCTWDWS